MSPPTRRSTKTTMDADAPSVTPKSELCRICGKESSNVRKIFDEPDLADKIRTTFSTAVFPEDSLPQDICDRCFVDVNAFHTKILVFKQQERKWVESLKHRNPCHPYVKASKLIDEHHLLTLKKISELSSPSGDFGLNESSSSSILMNILLNRHIYQVKPLESLCIDFFNKNGPDLLQTVLYVPDPIGSSPASEADSYVAQMDDHTSVCTDDNSSVRGEITPTYDRAPIPKTKKKPNPVRDYIYKKRRNPNSLKNLRNRYKKQGKKENSQSKHSGNAEADTESLDSVSVSPANLRRLREHQKPSRSSERIIKAAVKQETQDDLGDRNKETDQDQYSSNSSKKNPMSARIGIKLQRNPDGTFKKPTSTDVSPVARVRQRSTTRINYSEALVDEALMYEEILLNKADKEKQTISNTVQQSKLEQRSTLPENKVQMKIRRPESLNQWSMEEKPYNSATPLKHVKHLNKPRPSWSLDQLANRELSIEQVSSTKKQTATIEGKPSISIRSGFGNSSKFVSLTDIKNKLKINPESVLNFNSSVSITLKSPKQSETSTTSPISGSSGGFKAIAPYKINLSTDGGKPINCKYCEKKCPNIKELAVHQMEHLRIKTHRVGSQQILNPKLRRGRMVPVGQQKFFRCLNCWRLHPNSQSILEHWVSGKCLFYCSICGKSFHDNPKLIRDHFIVAHRIKYKVPEQGPIIQQRKPAPPQQPTAQRPIVPNKSSSAKPPSNKPVPLHIIQRQLNNMISSNNRIPAKVQKSGRVTCEICFCSFPNMHSRNSHMRLHKNEMMAAELKQKGSKDSPYYQLDFKQKPSYEPPLNRQRLSHINNNQIATANRFNNGESSQSKTKPNQLKQLLLQKPRAFNFQKPREATVTQPPPLTTPLLDGSLKVKDEPQMDVDDQFHDFINAAMSSADTEYVDTDYSTLMTPLQDLIESPSTIIKTEPGGGGGGGGEAPRIQIKKLHELQSPSGYEQPPLQQSTMSDGSAYYQTPPHQHHAMHHHQQQPQPGPSYMQHHDPHMQPPPSQSMQIHPSTSAQHQMIGQTQQMQQFQISQVQQMQNSQYYNPVFVVQQQSAVPSHQQPQPQQVQQSIQGDMMYQQYGNDPYTDYSKYYS